MKNHVQIAVALLLSFAGFHGFCPEGRTAEPRKYPAVGKIERVDPRFDELIPRDAVLEKLAEGFAWTEGPVWVRDGGYLLFSDIPRNSIMKWKEGEGISQFMNPAGYTGATPRGGESGTNGLLLDREGRLVMCQHGDRRIVRVEKDGRWTTLVDRYEGKRLNSPNDAVFKSNGDLYFTDPPYGLPKGPDDPTRELAFCGVYRVSTKGEVTLLTDKMTRPNGIGFSPDEKTLYVAQSDPEKAVWMAFELKPDGTLGRGSGLLRRHALGQAEAARTARRTEGGQARQPLRHRAGRRERLRPRRHLPGPHQHRSADIQLPLRRRRLGPLRHRQPVALPDPHEHKGAGVGGVRGQGRGASENDQVPMTNVQ